MPLTMVEVEALRELVAAELEKNGVMDELWKRGWRHEHMDGGTKGSPDGGPLSGDRS